MRKLPPTRQISIYKKLHCSAKGICNISNIPNIKMEKILSKISEF